MRSWSRPQVWCRNKKPGTGAGPWSWSLCGVAAWLPVFSSLCLTGAQIPLDEGLAKASRVSAFSG